MGQHAERVRLFAVLVVCDALGIRQINQYLMAYDLEANNGHGSIAFTPNLSEALVWTDPCEVLKALSQSPKNHPVRADDGMPNRPLRAFTVQLVELPANMIQQQLARQKGN